MRWMLGEAAELSRALDLIVADRRLTGGRRKDGGLFSTTYAKPMLFPYAITCLSWKVRP